MMMIRRLLLTTSLALLPCCIAVAQDAKSFRLEIGPNAVEIDPGETIEMTLPDGTQARVKLTRNEFATYVTDSFSFVHPSGVSVTRSDLGDGVIQHLMASAIGTIAIVQEYQSIDPALLAEFMLGELTRDAVTAGAKIEKQPHSRVAGQKLVGLKAAETGSGETIDYEVLAYGAGSHGVLIVTSIDEDNKQADGPMLTKFWDSLTIK